MLDRVVIAMRQSPGWAGLARDHRAGRPIDPARYLPPRQVPDFPVGIVELIARWNALSNLDFFTCRARLKQIAMGLLFQIPNAVLTSCDALPATLASLDGARFALFFCDDDDWFAPHLYSTLAGLDFTECDVAVFPFVRFGRHTCTFLDPAVPPAVVVAPSRGFSQRYHTNNYALQRRICSPETLLAMQDHFDASAYGGARHLADRQFGVIVSATNKSPCAASFLHEAVAGPAEFRAALTGCIATLQATVVPAGLAWMRPPVDATIALFREALLA
jgi:hypothetical protein